MIGRDKTYTESDIKLFKGGGGGSAPKAPPPAPPPQATTVPIEAEAEEDMRKRLKKLRGRSSTILTNTLLNPVQDNSQLDTLL